MASPRRWKRLTGSIRVRTTLAATLIVAVTLSVGSAIMVARFRASLDANRRNAAIARAADIAALASSGRLPAVLVLPNQDATFAQVVSGAGQVLSASANVAGEPPVSASLPGGTATVVTRLAKSPVDGDASTMLVSVPGGSPGRPVTVLAGYSLVSSDFAVSDVKVGLLVAFPVLLLVVAGTTWMVVGRTLRPIDAIRSEASKITGLGARRRVPDPGSRDEVAKLAATMNLMLDRLEASYERQNAFVADASHELRSPLASLRAQLEVGLAGGDRTDWRSTVRDALAEEARLERMVSDLLLLARLDQGDPAPSGAEQRGFDLGEIVVTDLRGRPDRRGVVVRADLRQRASIRMPKEHARRLIANLVDNAQRHAVTAVTVTVDVEGGDWAVLAVQDDGPGIPPEDRARVFERFTRLDRARAADDGGAGLGLAIVKDIVVRQHGTVRVADSSAGARIEARIPLHDDGGSRRARPAVPARESPRGRAGPSATASSGPPSATPTR